MFDVLLLIFGCPERNIIGGLFLCLCLSMGVTTVYEVFCILIIVSILAAFAIILIGHERK